METSIFFTLELLPTDAKSVSINIGSSEAPMKNIYSQNTKTLFQFQLKIEKPEVFPLQIPYSYSFDGNKQRMVIIKSEPHDVMYVNDTKIIRPESVNFHTVTFFLRVKCQSNSQVLIVSPQQCFWQNNKRFNQIRMSYVRAGVYKCTVLISADTFAPISYKYFVSAPTQMTEKGRSHTLVINSPIGGKVISVYDSFLTSASTFPLFAQPIDPSECDAFHTQLHIEYSPCHKLEQACISFSNDDNDEDIELLSKDVVWKFDKQYNKLIGRKIFFGMMPEGKKEFEWDESETLKIDETANKVDCVAIRSIHGATFNRSVGVYIDLVSLPLTKSSPCGSFASIKKLVEWAKECGLGYLHISIERINDNRLIDPVLANETPDDAIGGMKIDEIREKKIALLYTKYQEWVKIKKIDLKYIEFMKFMGQFISPLCPSQFALYVQYVLYKELADASTHAMENGISLVLDVLCDDTPGSLDQQIQILSPFASYLKIVNGSSFLSPISFTDVVSIFGKKTQSVLNAIDVIGTAVFIKPRYSRDFEAAAICKIEPSEYSDFCQRFNHLSALATSEERRTRSQEFYQFFASIANVAASAVLLDEAASSLFNEDIIRKSNIVPCTPHGFYEPSFLSPEVFSEFSSPISETEAISRIQRKLSSSAKCVTLYLGDLMHALGINRIAGEKICDKKHHNRFVLNVSAEDLLSKKENNKTIFSFLDRFYSALCGNS